ncbi:Apc13p-domain-containing protein [Lentithecium fluviatile CBS 122367]|uniref:Apc13p-domain-containing protein n=1 Tax=Lentithecium fluviatile CBS 122367 TaxID=1168545 RepID=A0A6G1IKU8_9PLEO|nr:Apc13p-domain-containing protein [Lentithecium fluviatile CBS 122367]
MTRDSTATYLHLHASHHADLIEEFTRAATSKLPDEEIYVPPQHQPLNPEDEDDVVPDQHAAFGIQRATQGRKEASWKDLGLGDLMRRGPGEGSGGGAGGMRGLTFPTVGRHEPVRLALRRRRPGLGVAGGGGLQSGGGGTGNGLPR